MQEVIAAAVLTNERIARMIGLNVVDFQTYGLLLRRGAPMTPGEVSAATALPSSTTTRVLDRLEAKGMVRREADAEDRRKVLVHALPFDAAQVGQAYEQILKQMADGAPQGSRRGTSSSWSSATSAASSRSADRGVIACQRW